MQSVASWIPHHDGVAFALVGLASTRLCCVHTGFGARRCSLTAQKPWTAGRTPTHQCSAARRTGCWAEQLRLPPRIEVSIHHSRQLAERRSNPETLSNVVACGCRHLTRAPCLSVACICAASYVPSYWLLVLVLCCPAPQTVVLRRRIMRQKRSPAPAGRGVQGRGQRDAGLRCGRLDGSGHRCGDGSGVPRLYAAIHVTVMAAATCMSVPGTHTNI